MEYIDCSQKRYDCLFCVMGRCLSLDDTEFRRVCPFYKPSCMDYSEVFRYPNYPGRFKRVFGAGNNYLIGDQGIVINSHKQRVTERADRYGFPAVRLQYLQHFILVRVDLLVASAFIPGQGGRIVHVDGNIKNCRAENLTRLI